ncbi:uncharacterized protein KIAA1755 homolog [Carettochelys insculpta]|uniref:uncharacterized protein KIAA1755 homolog n=1 Tax=Carettochelys insculpta TaxID=44489 RepID=UPI003EBC1D04
MGPEHSHTDTEPVPSTSRMLMNEVSDPWRKDPRSLDVAVQSTLLALYPPFEVTAPTVLSQLFRLLDSDYQGDGLCCLLDFLIPAKRLFEHLRQAACEPYFNCIFLHEGWPLCLHEKVVVHLAPLNPLLLRPGDFYLQAEPYGEQSACITVKCLSQDLRTVDERPVPASSYALLFTSKWLEELNRDRSRTPLYTCLVATEKGIAPLPWSKIATPEFVSKPKAAPSPTHELDLCSAEVPVKPASQGCTRPLGLADAQMPHGNNMGSIQGCKEGPWRSSQGKYPGLIKVDQVRSWRKPSMCVVPTLFDVVSQDLEGDYVDLLEFTEEMNFDLSTKSGPSEEQSGPSGESKVLPTSKSRLPIANRGSAVEKWTCGKGQSSEEGPCTLCLRRKLNRDPKFHGPRCRYRESYVAALQNPVSFGSGLMTAILEESDVPKLEFPLATTARASPSHPPQRPGQAAAPRLPSGCPQQAATPEMKAEEVTKQGHLKLFKSPAGAMRKVPWSQSPPASHKFSFLKGQRQPAPPGASLCGTSQQEGTRKRVSVLYSPRTSRAKPDRTGADQMDGSLIESSSPQGTICKDGPCAAPGSSPVADLPPAEPSPPELPPGQVLCPELLHSGIACLPGSRDKLGRALLQVNTSSRAWEAPWCSATEVAHLFRYLCSIPRREARDQGLTIVVDARRQPPSPTLYAAFRSFQSSSPASIHGVLLLAEKEVAAHLEKLPGMQVEVLTSLRALGRYVDSTQLTLDLDGTFPYCHSQWVQFFQKLHPFVASLKQASKLLQSSIQELEKGNFPEDMQEAAKCSERYRELMEVVLSNTQLVSLQREGGAMLARLRKEASWLSFSPDIRNSVDSAVGLYNQVEEEVHTLVTKSNSCLERLEQLQKIWELEAEFSQLNCWIDEGESRLCELSTWEGNPDSPERSYQQFKEFFIQATACYHRGLELCKKAVAVQGSMLPEAEAFEAARVTTKAKLTSFYANVERQLAELEALLKLGRFSDEVTLLNLDCRHHAAGVKLGEGQPASREAQQSLEKWSQQLSEQLSAESFQVLKVQAYTMCSCRGLGEWNKTCQMCQETRQIPGETLGKSKETQGVEPDHRGEKGSSSSAVAKSGPRVQSKDPHVCKAAPNPAQASAGRETQVTEPGCCRARSGTELKPPLSADSALRVDAGDPCSSQQEPLFCSCQEAQGGGCACQGCPTAGSRPRRAARGADLEQRDQAQNPSMAALESLHVAPTLKPPLTSPSQARGPETGQFPLDSVSESLGEGSGPAPSTRSQELGRQMLEAAQYFQVSRHGSFSSKDAESQNLIEEPSTPHPILPRELVSPQLPRPGGNPLEIIYLENHHTKSHAKANPK